MIFLHFECNIYTVMTLQNRVSENGFLYVISK
jgi:hypothetical protein